MGASSPPYSSILSSHLSLLTFPSFNSVRLHQSRVACRTSGKVVPSNLPPMNGRDNRPLIVTHGGRLVDPTVHSSNSKYIVQTRSEA